jgi:hypothetical protein
MARNIYVHYGSPSGLEDLLPHVRIRVLGPPTPEQAASTRHPFEPDKPWQHAAEQQQFWRDRPGGPADGDAEPFADAPVLDRDHAAAHARWFCRRIDEARAAQTLELVRSLDRVINDTSVILLFEVGQAKLLFPGDAQLESWGFALEQAGVAEDLAGVTFYKVGHHGSLDATPRRLWHGFAHMGGEGAPGRLQTALSTFAGAHGHPERGTEVPRPKLVGALHAKTSCVATPNFGNDRIVREIEIPI